MPVTACTERDSPHADVAVSAADVEFLERFENCVLPEEEWTHLAHLRIAWTCFNLDPADAALERIRAGILRYNTKVLGRPHKYHETVTVAFARLVNDRMRRKEPWQAFSQRIDDLLDADSPVLLQYYSQAILQSDVARQHFVPPDREPLPSIRH